MPFESLQCARRIISAKVASAKMHSSLSKRIIFSEVQPVDFEPSAAWTSMILYLIFYKSALDIRELYNSYSPQDTWTQLETTMLLSTCFGYSKGQGMDCRVTWKKRSFSGSKFYFQNIFRDLLFDTQVSLSSYQLYFPPIYVKPTATLEYLFPVESWQVQRPRIILFMQAIDLFVRYSVRNDIKLKFHSTKSRQASSRTFSPFKNHSHYLYPISDASEY